jgi:GT2 family glycosyltransferase
MLPQVAFLLSSYNRRAVVLRTLAQLREVSEHCGVPTQTIVVDNASTDGTADAIANAFPEVTLLREPINRGACSKNVGLTHTTAPYIIFLDDDSYPDAPSIARMIRHFEADRTLGAAVFDVTLPDGSHECSAYPNVFIGCGTGFRADALKQVGGLPGDFFMQAEEYDLSLRLLDGGWEVRRFEDLRVTHLKTRSARIPTRTTRLDVRNNLTLVTRYFPSEWILAFALDWMRRYRWLAQAKGWRHHLAFWRGLIEGAARSLRPENRRPVSSETFEQFAMIEQIQQQMARLVQQRGIQSILLIDLGKNVLPFVLAARACGIEVVAIADAKLGRRGLRYHGIRVIDDAAAWPLCFDAALVANLSPVHAELRREQWRKLTRRPVIDLFEPSDVRLLAA